MQVYPQSLLNDDPGLKVWKTDTESFFDQLRKKDLSAFKLLYQKYSPALYGNILRAVKDEEKAKRALENIFIEIWQDISSFNESKSSLFIWLNKIACKHIKSC